jgi:hypothetical protein
VYLNQKSSTLQNPVQELWQLVALYGYLSELKIATYAVMFVSKLGDKNSITFLVEDLIEKKADVLKELNRIGVMEQRMYKPVLDYVKQLKMAEIYERVPSLDAYLSQDAREREAIEMYQSIVDAIEEEPDQFPTISSGHFELNISDGVILDTEDYISKYGLRNGVGAVAVTTELVKEILMTEETRGVRFLEITRTWLQQGYLLKREKGRRVQEWVSPWPDRSDERFRFYIFRIDDLQTRLDHAFEDEEVGEHA